MLVTLEWHQAGLSAANYAAQQVMILGRKRMSRVRGRAHGAKGVLVICL